MLPAAVRTRARRTLLFFGVFNALSFTLLTGNLISLYLLRLGAGNTLIGIVASFGFVSFFFLLVGKWLVPRVGVMRLFAWAWLVRYVAILPILAAPAFLGSPHDAMVFLLVAVGTFGFQAARGVGIIANAPMFSGFATGADRGRLLSQFQIITAVMSITTGTAVAFLLGPDAAITRYLLFLSMGVAAGLIATGLVFSLPELDSERDSARTPLLATVREAAGQDGFRAFVRAFLLVAVASGVGRSFLVVFAKQAYDMTDRAAFLMVAIGSLGNVLAGYLGSVLLDRLGAKPIILFSLGAFLVSLLPAVATPHITGPGLYVLVGLVFFLATLGFTGAENASQAYFFGITHRDSRLNLGILYFLTLGLGGFLGSFAGGIVLDALAAAVSIRWSFRFFFGATIVVLGLAMHATWRLESLGAETFRGALEVIFSFRDLRAAGLVNRLTRSRTPDEEQRTIRDLAQSGSQVPIAEILRRVESPGYALRHEALDALAALPFSPTVETVLVRHLETGEHTTASQAAWLLGVRGSEGARPALWHARRSDDRLLAGRALVALARLGDPDAPDEAATVLERATNATGATVDFGDVMHAAVALQVAGTRDHLGSLGEVMSRRGMPDYVVDELVFAIARILGFHDWFYPYYAAYVHDADDEERLVSQYGDALSPQAQTIVDALERSGKPAEARRRLRDYCATATGLPWPDSSVVETMPDRGRMVFCATAAIIRHELDRHEPAPSSAPSQV